MQQWAEAQGIIPNCQFGFRGAHGTTCTIFVLNTLIEQSKWKQKKLLCGFIDFRKAFDSLELELLGRKLWRLGISIKVLTILQNMHSHRNWGGRAPPQYFTLEKYSCMQGRSLYIYICLVHVEAANYIDGTNVLCKNYLQYRLCWQRKQCTS